MNRIILAAASIVPSLAQAAAPETCDIYAYASSYGPRVAAAIMHAADFSAVDRSDLALLLKVTAQDAEDHMRNVSQASTLNSLGSLAIEDSSWEIKTSSLGRDFFTVSVDVKNETPATIAVISRMVFNLASPGRAVPWTSSADYSIEVPGGIEPGETITVGPKFDVIGHELPKADIPDNAEVVVTHITACGLEDRFIWSGSPSVGGP